MRTEQEVRELYRQYVYRYAIFQMKGDKIKENQFFGAALALGRTLNRDMKKIESDFEVARRFIRRLKAEGKPLPGFKELEPLK